MLWFLVQAHRVLDVLSGTRASVEYDVFHFEGTKTDPHTGELARWNHVFERRLGDAFVATHLSKLPPGTKLLRVEPKTREDG